MLVEKQVELADVTDGALYLLIEFMLEGLRQFMTFHERQHTEPGVPPRYYLDSLELLRGHLYRCLVNIGAIADVEIPKVPAAMRYDMEWQLEGYVQPPPVAAIEGGSSRDS